MSEELWDFFNILCEEGDSLWIYGVVPGPEHVHIGKENVRESRARVQGNLRLSNKHSAWNTQCLGLVISGLKRFHVPGRRQILLSLFIFISRGWADIWIQFVRSIYWNWFSTRVSSFWGKYMKILIMFIPFCLSISSSNIYTVCPRYDQLFLEINISSKIPYEEIMCEMKFILC